MPFFIKMPLDSSTKKKKKNGEQTESFSFHCPCPFLSFQVPLVSSWRAFSSIFNFPHSSVHFLVYIFFILPFVFYIFTPFPQLLHVPRPDTLLFTSPSSHESFLFMIRQACEWCCWGLRGPTVRLSFVQWSMVRNRPVFSARDVLELFSSSDENNLRGWGHYAALALPTHVQAYCVLHSRTHTVVEGEGQNVEGGTNKENSRPPYSLPHRAVKLYSALCCLDLITLVSHLLPLFHWTDLIVFLFI